MSASIKVGDTIPEAEFPTVFWSEELESGAPVVFQAQHKGLGRQKGVVVAVPGAFTPTCHVNHIPAYVKNSQLQDKGVDQSSSSLPMIHLSCRAGAATVLFVTDTYAEWSKKLGLSVDLTGHGLGERTGRYALILDDLKVTKLFVEPNPGAVSNTGAEHILAEL
ncbi:redoxin domain-containing protein [Rhizoctonia solani]|uniref:Redoxin domain-containing protein n=1 Tax=Rhizoctonia solani TaxID=456999 RepID=A0A8H8NVY6_9AGAM|nr:redoxin domain-containing protein [Rhizoctonia solani]QRW21091.1 redoxin domain-containing protein [Rhizoctonia solani]